MISKTGVAALQPSRIIRAGERVSAEARYLLGRRKKVVLPWIDSDAETQKFIRYWFGRKQIDRLRCLAYSLKYGVGNQLPPQVRDALRIALSRIIITKQSGASLAWDVSHSRPHKVVSSNNFDVFNGFERSYKFV